MHFHTPDNAPSVKNNFIHKKTMAQAGPLVYRSAPSDACRMPRVPDPAQTRQQLPRSSQIVGAPVTAQTRQQLPRLSRRTWAPGVKQTHEQSKTQTRNDG